MLKDRKSKGLEVQVALNTTACSSGFRLALHLFISYYIALLEPEQKGSPLHVTVHVGVHLPWTPIDSAFARGLTPSTLHCSRRLLHPHQSLQFSVDETTQYIRMLTSLMVVVFARHRTCYNMLRAYQHHSGEKTTKVNKEKITLTQTYSEWLYSTFTVFTSINVCIMILYNLN